MKILFAILVVFVAWVGFFLYSGDAFFFHTVDEAYVAVYKRWGRVLDDVAGPGLHFMNPFTTDVTMVQTTLQTDVVTDIPCGTKGGVMVYFDRVEVVNRLGKEFAANTIRRFGEHYDKIWIFDRIHHEINQFCSSNSLEEVYITRFSELDEGLEETLQRECDKWETGIEIINIRVTKPRIPDAIARNFEDLEREKTRQLVIRQQEQAEALREQIRAEKDAKIAAIEAEKVAAVSRIYESQKTEEKRAEAERQLIENDLHISKQRAITDADYDRQLKEADGIQRKLTPEYLTLTYYQSIAQALSQQNLIYFGKDLPDMFHSIIPPSIGFPQHFQQFRDHFSSPHRSPVNNSTP